jgi:hypothetical protein
MKILFATAVLLGLAQAVHAQTAIKAGTIQLGGNVGYSRTSQDRQVLLNGGNIIKETDINSQFSIAPSVGFFVADNLAVGINASYQSTNQYDARFFQVGAFVQYYQMVSEQFGFTGTLGAGYQHAKYSFSSSDKQNGFYAGLTPGLVFFPIPKLAIGASIGGLNYSRLSSKNNGFSGSDTYNSSTFGANFGLAQLLFSGTYYFGR